MACRGAFPLIHAALILVHYNTAHDLLSAVAGLLGQRVSLELVVVDNASRPDERERLAALPRDVRVVWSDANLGYGAAINRGVALTTAPVVGFANPDVVALDGAVKVLLDVLEQDARVGVVGPRAWWDGDRRLLLPPIRLPTLAEFAARWLAGVLPAFGRAYARRLARWVAGVGHAPGPRPLPMLSGTFALARREVFDAVGGFDPGFPLYLEDADWCRRVARAGYRLVYVPAAEIVHHYDQSARQISAQAEAWRRQSVRHYLRKYYGAAGEAILRALERARPGAAAIPAAVEDLGVPTAPPRLALPPGTGAVQVGYHPLFLDAALGLAEGGEWQFPPGVWARLRDARYFVRALARGSWRPLKVWTWERRIG